ncbi:hypothetical protein ACHAXT_006943 [Thalassiosira profunda]
MELLRSQLAESAKAAAGAARQLSALDDMAQADDYVQSEGLRISAKKDTSAAPSFSDNSPSVVEDLSGRFVDALSTAARKQTRPRPVADQNLTTTPQNNMNQPSTARHQTSNKSRESSKPSKVMHKPKRETQKTKLISSVAELYDAGDKKRNLQQHLAAKDKSQKQQQPEQHRNHKSRSSTSKGSAEQSALSLAAVPSSPGHKTNVLLVNDHAHILHELDYDSDTSSDDDEPGESQQSDIEMGGVGNAALHYQLEQELEESILRQNSLDGQTNGNQPKDVHRFMKMTTDLESERRSLLSSMGGVPEATPKNAGTGAAGEETNKALQAGLSWMRNVASPQLETFSKQIMSAVSEADFRTPDERQRRGPLIGPRHTPLAKDQEEEKITMTSSAAFLADADMAELERIRMRNSPSKIRALVQQCIDNPRLAFIAVTLVLALLAYFYSRHRSVDDVL